MMTSQHSATSVQTVTLRTSNVLKNGKVEVTLTTDQSEVRTTCSAELANLLNDPDTDPQAVQIFVRSLLSKAVKVSCPATQGLVTSQDQSPIGLPSHSAQGLGTSQDQSSIDLPSHSALGLGTSQDQSSIDLPSHSAQGLGTSRDQSSIYLPSHSAQGRGTSQDQSSIDLPSHSAQGLGSSQDHSFMHSSSHFAQGFVTSTEARTWTKQAEKSLVTAFQEIDLRKKGMKNRWLKIAGVMESNGYYFTSEQCRLKYKGLKERYERQKKKNGSSGESPAEEDDIFDMLADQADMNPKHLLESCTGLKRKSSSGDKSDSCGSEVHVPESPQVTDKNKDKRRKESVTQTLTTLFQEREKKQTERHEEKMRAVNSLIGVLKDMANK